MGLCGPPASQGPDTPRCALIRPSWQLCRWVGASPGHAGMPSHFPHAQQHGTAFLGWFASGRHLGQSARFKYFAQLFTLGFILLVICVFRYEYFSELSPVCGLSFASLNSIFLKSMVLKVLVKSNSFFFFSGWFFGGCF